MNEFGLFRWQKECFLDSTTKFNIYPMGRRVGKTQGASYGCLIKAIQGETCLWVDTVNSNIDRYYERYFLPVLKKSNYDYVWNVQKKLLKVENGYIDFRSADRPENIEGFGYRNIFLNEAGIILNNDYLFTNAILPMLIDHEDSQLFAFGTPKGVYNKDAKEHKFYTLWKKVQEGQENYNGKQLSSYANPLNNDDTIKELEEEIDDEGGNIKQEIYGEFVTASDEILYTTINTYDSFREEDVEARIGFIDPAFQGTDSMVLCIGALIGGDVYIDDVLCTDEGVDITIPECVQMIDEKKPDYVWCETNGGGYMFFTSIEEQVNNSTVIGVNSVGNKHTRILNSKGFVCKRVYFKSSYDKKSHYGRFMDGIKSYNKIQKKNLHDDPADCLACLVGRAKINYSHLY